MKGKGTSAGTDRGKAGAPPPEEDEAQQQLDAAMALQALAEEIQVQVRPGTSMDREPRWANDLREKTQGRALAAGAKCEAGRLILRALQIPGEAVIDDVDRHGDLWGAYEEVKGVRRGARDGRRICDRLRQVARMLVDAEALALLRATTDDRQRSALISDLRDISLATLERRKEQAEARRKLDKIQREGRARLRELEARDHLHQIMAAMRRGEDLPWDQVMAAVETYEALYGSLDDEASEGAASDPGQDP